MENHDKDMEKEYSKELKNFMDYFKDLSYYTSSYKKIENEDIPEDIRNNIGIAFVQRLYKEGKLKHLLYLAKNERVSECIREMAGNKVVDLCRMKIWGGNYISQYNKDFFSFVLLDLISDDITSENVKKEAAEVYSIFCE